MFLGDRLTMFDITITENGVPFPNGIPVGSTAQIKLRAPSGTTLTRAADIEADRVRITYVTPGNSDEITEVGIWDIVGVINTASGGRWSTVTGHFPVKRTIP